MEDHRQIRVAQGDDAIGLQGDDQSGSERQSQQPKACFLTGAAGTGKSFLVTERLKANPNWALVCATTGIAATNLGVVTLASTLGYFDTESLIKAQKLGHVQKKLREIRQQYAWLLIDEVSMLPAEQLTIIVEEADEAGLGVYLTGDFLQLPPVKASWAFESPCWDRFDANTARLTKVWRQTEGNLLNALNFARAGNGEAAAACLDVEWHSKRQSEFDGTTLISKNEDVDEYNRRRLAELPGSPFTLTNRKWGKQSLKNVPETLDLQVGAYVMLQTNKYSEFEKDLLYANGDCGHVLDHAYDHVLVKLVRTGEEVVVERVLRDVSRPKRPKPWFSPRYGGGLWLPEPHWQAEKEKFVEGQTWYWPIRLAYASTIHKCQGLSLDRIQFDFNDSFCGQPAMMYVALSRARTMEGLRLVGSRERFIQQVRIDPKVRRWL